MTPKHPATKIATAPLRTMSITTWSIIDNNNINPGKNTR